MTTSAEPSVIDPVPMPDVPVTQTPPLERPTLNDALSLPKPARTRLHSLDIFRGITIVGMLLVNNVDEAHAYAPLLHSPWHGWTPTDLIFPFFMFIMGVAIPFSLAKRLSNPSETRTGLLGHIWLRALSLFMLGMLVRAIFSAPPTPPEGFGFLKVMAVIVNIFAYASIIALLVPWRSRRISNWLPPIIALIFFVLLIGMHFIVKHATDQGLSPAYVGSIMFRPENFRIPGVLQRIGICYGMAATIGLYFNWKLILSTILVLLAGYSALMLAVPFHNDANEKVIGSLTRESNLERKIDETVFDRYTTSGAPDYRRTYTQKHTYGDYPDPEGLLSTLPAVATPLLGILLGLWLLTDRSNVEKCAAMLSMGVFVAILGCCLGAWLMPINKKIWTPSFVVFTAGMAMLGLGAIFWLVDVRGKRRWAMPFAIFGMNSIAAYVGGDVLLRVSELIKVHGVQLSKLIDERCTESIHHFSAWLQMHSTNLPMLDTPANLAMVFAIVLIVATGILLTPLYLMKIYLKV